MEELSDDDVKEFASHWVKRIQNSILTAGDDVSTRDVVRTGFGSSDERRERRYTNHEFREENGEIDFSNPRLGRPFLADFRNSVTLKQFPDPVGATGVGEEHVVSFENASKHSNVDRVSKTTDPQEKKITPRPDADFLRQKRLAFFASSLGPQEKEDSSLFHGSNRNISKHISASQVPLCDREAHGSSIEHFYPLQSNAKQKTSDEMYKLESLETPLLSSFSGGNSHSVNKDSFDYQNINSPRGFETDEEEIKLELWGLKEAVHSGELDLKAYLREPSWKDQRLFSASSRKLENNCNNHYNGKSPRETCRPLHDKIRPSCDLNLTKTKCTDFNCPEPQINGPLYSGFENSDSETSLLSFGSKCDDVRYRKVVKKQRASIVNGEISPRQKDHSINKKQGHKLKQKRGKDKILMELTEFIEGCGTPKDLKHSKQNGSIVSDLHPPDVHVPSVISEDGLSVTVGHMENEFARRDDLISRTEDPSYNTCISESSNAQSHDHKLANGTSVLSSEGHGNVKGKVCPKCDEVNSKAANWCIECGTALISVKVSCLTAQQQKVFEKQCEETQALIKETLKAPMNFSHLLANDKAEREERTLSEDISNLSLQVSQSTNNLEETRYSSSPHGYKRRWMRSSIAWSTYHPSELTKSSSVVKNQVKTKERQRAISFSDLTTCSTKEKGSKHHKRGSRNKSARKRTVSCSSFGPEEEVVNSSEGFTNLKAFGHPRNSSLKGGQKEKQSQTSVVHRVSPSIENQMESSASAKGRYSANLHNGMINTKSSSSHSLLKSSSTSSFEEMMGPSKSQVSKAVVPPLNLQDVGSYDRILTLIRSQRDSEPVPYLYLPDEILLQIFSFLPHKDLVSCSRVCSQFYRISMDESLWKVIVLKKNNNITDEWLCAIGKRRPTSLTISQCHSDKVTAKGLRDLFRNCSDSLEELNFSSCRGSELIGESVLLHVAARCCWLKSVDASWSNVSDNGVQAVVDNVKRLECLCLNGCQAVSDESIKCVASKHGKTLRIFEVFGCFNISPAGIRILGQTCKQLQTLNIGQCHKITDSAIGSLVSNLPELENLDLRGCMQVRDSAVKKIVCHCPLITTLALANCPLITDVSLAEIATNLPRIRSLDICGCSKVSDHGICTLSKSCQRLELLDLTSTGVGHKSVLALANYCSQSLCNLKLSFCTDISESTVVHLAKHCKRLTMLHLYGCKRIRNTSDLRMLNPALTIEIEY